VHFGKKGIEAKENCRYRIEKERQESPPPGITCWGARRGGQKGWGMQVQNKSITVYSQGVPESGLQDRLNPRGKEKNQQNKTVFAGDVLGSASLQDRIGKRREMAQKRALKIVNDAWDADRILDDEINVRRERIRELREENEGTLENLKEVNRMERELREQFGVEINSEEQKELELMKRRWNCDFHPTEEDQERLARIDKKEKTEYQRRALEIHRTASYYRGMISSNNARILKDDMVIHKIRQEKLKHHNMTDAQENAEDVMESVTDEVVNLVVEDAKEKIDQEKEDREEQAGEIEEKREEQEEIREKRDERDEELEKLLEEEKPVEEMADKSRIFQEVRNQMEGILNEISLAAEEMKGAMVDIEL